MTEKVTFTGAQETTLATLYGKAMESRRPDSVLRDTVADNALQRIDYDFGRLRVRRSDHASLAVRAKAYDIWARQFIDAHPHCTVLHLGCGLDTRVYRVDPPPTVTWYDVDFPDVIALRRKLFEPEVAMIAKSVTDPTLLDGVPGDTPVLVIAEGVTPYLPADEGIALLRRITGHFPSGELLFDGYGRWGLWFLQRYGCVKASGALLGWSIGDPRELEDAVPGLRFDAELWYSDAPGMHHHLSRVNRALLRAVYRVPALRRLGRPLRYTFG
ncbi:class I SAM-dependent methyltransferase [Mycobacterium sp. NPDC003449]